MSNINNTAGALGFATAVADILVWRYNGHPLPVPDDVVASLAVVVGVSVHAFGIAAVYVGRIANVLVQKKLGITVNPTNADGAANLPD